MDELSRGARGQSPGKLLTVLRHGLRGLQGDEGLLADSYRERGLPVPDHLLAPPRVEDEYSLYWSAYADLQHERPPAMPGRPSNRIPWSAIARYSTHHGLNVDELKRYIWALDSEFINSKPVPSDPEPANG